MSVTADWKPHRIFYGWWVVAACFLISLYTGGVVFYGFTAFFEPLAEKFNWTYTQISFAASLRGLEAGLLAPIVGMLVDRWGPRRLLAGGAIITTLGLILLSRTASLAMFYGAFILLAVGLNACSSTVFMTAVANWFHRKIGIATGIMLCGYGLSGLLIPLIVRLIDMYGWEKALTILALGLLATCLPLSLLVRHKPEQYGYQPDDKAPNATIPNNSVSQAKIPEVDIGIRQVLKTRTFWHITAAMLCQMVLLSAVITHVMPYLTSINIDRTRASIIAGAIPLTSIVGRIGLGWLGDRFDKRRMIATAFAMISGGLLCFAIASPRAIWLLTLFLIFFGVGYGGNNTLRASVISEYFGRNNFGAIHGFVLSIMALGGVASPPLAGWVFDNWKTYRPVWFAFAALAIVAVLTAMTIPPVNSKNKPVDKTLT